MAYQREINAMMSWNYPARSSNFMDIIRTVSMAQPRSFSCSAVNYPWTLFRCAPSSMYPFMFCLNESSWVHAGMNNGVIAASQFLMFRNLTSDSGHAEIRHSNTSPLTIPSANTQTTGLPMGPTSNFSPHGVHQFNTDLFRTLRGRMAFSSRDALPNNSGRQSNQVPGVNESNTAGAFPPGHGQSSGQNGVGKHSSSTITSEGGKKRCLGENPGNSDMPSSSKRPRISSDLHAETEEPQMKELLLFKDVDHSSSELGISLDDREEIGADLDLSLHL